MATPTAQSQRPAGRLLQSAFLGYMLAAAAAAIAVLVLSAYLERGTLSGIGVVILRDFGIALLIAAFVTVTIEYYAGTRLSRKIASDVLTETFQKLVPEVIFVEVRDNIFRSNVIRRDWDLDIAILDRLTHENDVYHELDEKLGDIASGLLVAETRISYVLENLNDKSIIFPIIGAIDLDAPMCPSLGIPGFEEIEVETNGDKKVLRISREQARTVLEDPSHVERVDDLTLQIANKQVYFELECKLGRRAKARVSYKVKRPVHIPGLYMMYTPVPADGIRIKLKGEHLAFDVLPLHPNRDRLRKIGDSHWEMQCGILPWQGFKITAERAVKS